MSELVSPNGVKRAGLVLLLLAAGGWEALRTPDADVVKGNQDFAKARYAEALDRYRAAEERGANPRIHFDMGAALYKLGEKSSDEAEKAKLFGQAEEEFRRAADTSDAALRSLAYYNLGNTMYQRGQWDEAIAAYKRALRAGPQNQRARHNLEMALRRREKQSAQQQGRPGQQRGQGHEGRQGQHQDRQPGPPQGRQPGPQDQGQDREQDQRGEDQNRPGQPEATDPQTGAQGGSREKQKQGGPAGRDQEREEESPPDNGDDGAVQSESPSDQALKLDELERRSRDLRKRLLRQGGSNRDRDRMRLPSGRDW